MRKTILLKAGFLAVFILLTPFSGNAQIHTVTVSVKGMACPFCAYGVEKKLKKVKGVENISIDMKEGTVTLKAKEGLSIEVGQVPRAILDSGFTPGEINVVAEGVLEAAEREIILRPGGAPGLVLEGLKAAERNRLLALAEAGARITIKGAVRRRPDGARALSPETLDEISK